MLSKLMNYLLDVRDRQRMLIALSKGTAMMQARCVDLTHPASWEFSGFSQNGEDGILDVLRRQLISSNRYFIEIGASDGIENNSAWLVLCANYNGIMVEGNPRLAQRAQRMLERYGIGVECLNRFITLEQAADFKRMARYSDPDVFSLDIDGNDYYIGRAILESGLRPRIWVVEYNSAYGPTRSVTINYQENFVFTKAHATHLYYGVSVAGWRKLFEAHGYRFVTVDQNGVNAFFVDPAWFDASFLNGIRSLTFAENASQYKRFQQMHEGQFALIASENIVTI
jgi:hypothetical protein